MESHIIHPTASVRLPPEDKEVQLLGHVVLAEGIAPNPEKVAAVKDFKVPYNLKKVRAF